MLRRSSLLALALLGCRSAEPAPIASEPPEPAVADEPTLEPSDADADLPLPEPEPPTEGGAFEVTSDNDVWGNLEGTPVGEAYGRGGLGQVGTGRGCTDCDLPGYIGLGTLGTGSRNEPLEPKASITVKSVSGSLDSDFSRRIVRAKAKAIHDCWGDAGSETFDLTLWVDGRGHVTSSEVSTKDEAIQRCIESATAAWRFPATAGTVTVTVTVDALPP